MPKKKRPSRKRKQPSQSPQRPIVPISPPSGPPPGTPIKTASEAGDFDDSYNFCDDDERQRLVDRMQDDLEAIQNRSLSLGQPNETTNVRFTFTFTNSQGIDTIKMFTSFDSLAAFLLVDATRSASVGLNEPDWSPLGLCQYGKELTMGVGGFRIDANGIKSFLGFKPNFPIYHYYGI